MTGPVARYTSSVRCYWFSILALAGAAVASWIALRFPVLTLPAAALLVLGIAMLGVARLPAIEIGETSLIIGRRPIAWNEIRGVDQTRWLAPLALHLTVAGGERVLVVHAGGRDSSAALLRHIRRRSRYALLDGIPYRQFWGETAPADTTAAVSPTPSSVPGGAAHAAAATTASAQTAGPQRVRLMRAEDEEEIERMFQRLKSVGRLDTRDTRGSDEG